MWEIYVEFTPTRFPLFSRLFARVFPLFSIFPLTFPRLSYWNRRRFFFSTWLPVTPLEVSWLGLKTVRLSERPRGRKGGPKCRLFFILMQPHAPRRGTFSPNRSENFAITDVCNWQIILMVILDEKRAIVNRKGSLHNIWRCHIDISSPNLLRDHRFIFASNYSKLERYKN